MGTLRAQLRAGRANTVQISLRKFRNLKFSISPNLLLGGRGATRAWLDMRKRVLNTRPRARDSRPYAHPDALDEDYGEPLPGSHCAETSTGSKVWRREWTKATVELDCNSFEATITKK